MRTIKFKGKRIDSGDWIYGLPTIRHDGKCFIQELNSGYGQDGIEVDIKTLTEFTGLKDKNGKEICEGDILLTNEAGWIAPVIYDYGSFYCKDKQGGFGCVIWDECEIIGNIYENPELLKQKL